VRLISITIDDFYFLPPLHSLNITSVPRPASSGIFLFHPINFSNPLEKAAHDKMVSLVERMLSLHKQSARTPREKEMLQHEIQSTDQAIDSLVYQLYSLTESEIKIVEATVAV
jgi:type II restriction/modification system DNA methylase subunit YeeA